MRYAMDGFEFGKELVSVAAFALLGLFEALADALVSVGAGGDVEQALIGSCVLNDGRRPALNRQDYGSLALFELFHKVAGPAAEGGQRLDILRNVKHRLPQIILSTLGAERPRLQCAARRQPLGSN